MEVIIGIIYTVLLIGVVIGNSYLFDISNTDIKWQLTGLSIKIIGALAFYGVYQLYYNGGDTFSYYKDAHTLWEAFKDHPSYYFTLISQATNHHNLELSNYSLRLIYFSSSAEWSMVRVTSVLTILSFGSYMGTNLLFAGISALGSWQLFLFFRKQWAGNHKPLFIIAFALPSCVFWNSGLLKDTLCLAALGFLCNHTYQLLHHRSKHSIAVIIGCLLLIGNIKAYIIACFAPPLLLWIYFHQRDKIAKTLTHRLIAISIGLSLLTPVFFVEQMLDSIEQSELFTASQQTLQGYHTPASNNQLKIDYTLAIDNYSFLGLITHYPQAIFTALYRPFIWEVKDLPNFIAALENLFFMAYTLFALGSIVKNRWRHPPATYSLLALCLIFSLSLAAVVGITSYNFGLLVRLKTPMLPFFMMGCYLMGQGNRNPIKHISEIPDA